MKAITGYQAVSTGGTRETLNMVDVSLRPHHHLTSGDRLPTSTTCPTVPEQPDIVILAEDHAPFAVAGGAVLAQLSMAAGTFQASRVPVAVHGEEHESVGNAASAASTSPVRGSHRAAQ